MNIAAALNSYAGNVSTTLEKKIGESKSAEITEKMKQDKSKLDKFINSPKTVSQVKTEESQVKFNIPSGSGHKHRKSLGKFQYL